MQLLHHVNIPVRLALVIVFCLSGPVKRIERCIEHSVLALLLLERPNGRCFVPFVITKLASKNPLAKSEASEGPEQYKVSDISMHIGWMGSIHQCTMPAAPAAVPHISRQLLGAMLHITLARFQKSSQEGWLAKVVIISRQTKMWVARFCSQLIFLLTQFAPNVDTK